MIQSNAKGTINPSEELIRIGPLEVRFLVTGDDSHGGIEVFECTFPAGEGLPAPPHSHDAYEETVYGLEGVVTWTVNGQPIEVGPGQALCIPRGAVHRFDNVGLEDAKTLIIASPATGTPEYFREIAAVIGASAGGPPDQARLADAFRRHGITLAVSGV